MTRCLARFAVLLLLLSCREVTTNLVSDPDAAVGEDAAAADASRPVDAAAPGDAAAPDAGARCGGRACACDDGTDNDADSLADGFDPECTGAFDDDEGTFATGSPTPMNRCRDCFWDDNAGPGDDGCRYPAECLTAPTIAGGGGCGTCEPSQGCIDSCLQRTPNGCDCFGCCEVARKDGSTIEVELADSCSLEKLDDEAACPRCMRRATCMNPCSPCELCPGRAPSDLPASCASSLPDGGVGHTCDHGLQVCSTSIPCQGTDYCQQGCCLLTVF